MAARKKILEQIERDKEERKKKLQQCSGTNVPAKAAQAPKPAPVAAGPAKEYTESRLQIRYVTGPVHERNLFVVEFSYN